MPLSLRVAVVLVVAALHPLAVGTQAPQPLQYPDAVKAYRDGAADAAFAVIAPLPARKIEKQVQAFISKENREARTAGRPRIWIHAAAVMHADYALVLEQTPGQRAFDQRALHEEAAATFVRALYNPPHGRRPDGPGSDEAFLRAWFRFQAAHNMGRGQYVHANYAIEVGRKQTGGDPELLLAAGALHELTWRMEHEEELPTNGFAGNLATADEALTAALAAEAHLDEARLRLGRVQAKEGHEKTAVRTLAALVRPETEAGFVYLARLFEGEAYERLGDAERAARAYTAATETMPAAQSAQVALAHLQYQHGQRDEALRRVTALAAGADTTAGTDPWLFYKGGVAWRGANYLDALRAMVRNAR